MQKKNQDLINSFLGSIENTNVFNFFGCNIYPLFLKDYHCRLFPIESQKKARRNIPMFVRQCYRIIVTAIAVFREIPASCRFILHLFSVFSHKKGCNFYFGFQDRIVNVDGTTRDIYSDRIIGQEDRQNYIIVQYFRDSITKVNSPDLIVQEGNLLFRFMSLFQRIKNRKTIKEKAIILHIHLQKHGYSIEEIKRMLSRYLSFFIFYKKIFAVIKPAKIYQIPFFGQDSIVAAAKSLKIHVIELQHGFTEYFLHKRQGLCPERFQMISSNTSWPDELYVWGDYWRNCAREINFIPNKQVVNAGYYLIDYLKFPSMKGSKQTESKKNMLITTSGFPSAIHKYLLFIRDRIMKEEWNIIVKPHRADQWYFNKYAKSIEEPGYVQILDSIASPYDILKIADIHVSQVSMLVFEARRFEHLTNYILYLEDYGDLWEQIVDSKAALPLFPNQIPNIEAMPSLDIKDFFGEYDEMLFR